MKIQLSDHFTYKKLLKFTLPSIVMMVFSSIYGVVDGFFVSNFAGETEFAALNFIYPFIMMLGAFGFMFGAGGSALISKTMGEGNMKKAQSLFSLIVYVSIGTGVVLAVLGIIFIRPIASLLGAEGKMLDDCVIYGRIILAALPAFMLQMEFQTFFVMAEKPKLGLYSTLVSGVANMALDALLVGIIPLGLVGAAMATAISQLIGAIIPLIYFFRPNTSILRLGKAEFDGKALVKTCTNGSSELMSNISMSLVGMLYNVQLMRYAGQEGVAAYGVLMYVNFVFISIFIGYVVGIAPVISYHYGAGNTGELKSLLRKSLVIISICSVAMLGSGEGLAYPFSKLFVSANPALFEMTLRGFRIYSFSFLFAGFAIFGSSFFTALNDGLTSAIISFLRTLLFQSAAVILLPLAFDLDGIWLSIIVAEVMAVAVTVVFMIGKRKKYEY
ncbi:MAG: MATE family efflux transporter [Ruminococcaceae bacterium]|nr:MATE family efflux transporter [Oscillospiraceae bacterium]